MDHLHELCTGRHPAFSKLQDPHCVECGERIVEGAEGESVPVDALDLCNGCGISPMADNPMGYCGQCLVDAYRATVR